MESINVKIDESSLLKTKKERRNLDILEDQLYTELKQEKEEEEDKEKQEEKKWEGEQGNNQKKIQRPKSWV